MTFGELKELAEQENIADDFEIDVIGKHSKGSFGSLTNIGKRTEPFAEGDYKEFQFFISA